MSAIVDGWQLVVVAEQAAMRGYGTLGPYLTASSSIALAQECEQTHRDLATQAAAGFTTAGGPSSPDIADYQLPFPVQDEQSAQRLAVQLEESTAKAWRYLLSVATSTVADGSTASTRPTAVTALTGSAVHAVQWRRLLTPTQASVPFPGV